jgi:lysophospholipase L1-like esterase
MTVLLGINDIGNSSATNPVTAGDIIAGYRQLISRAHSKGIAIYGATLTPFEGAAYYSADKELVREAVNNCIRTISVTRRWGRRCRWSCSGRSGPAI